jgi:hypothetical protein
MDVATDMTEQEWLHGNDLQAMLKHLSFTVSERKFRLTECAFHRRFWYLLSDVRNRRAVEVAERYADGMATKDELKDALDSASVAFDEILGGHFPDRKPSRPYWGGAVSAAQHTANCMYDCYEIFPRSGADNPKRFGNMWNLIWNSTAAYPIGKDASQMDGHAAMDLEQSAQVLLLHDLFGNPFQPVYIDRSWLLWNGGTIPMLTESIYIDRAVDRMAELGDALERAGCTSKEILEHCRGPGPHVRGCWVVDLLLGKN